MLAFASLAGLSACAGSVESTPPVPVSEVVSMAREGVPAEALLQKMRDSETVYRLSGSQLARLHEQGVPDPVLDYMQETYIAAVGRRQRLEDWRNWTLDDGFWYGGAAFGWPGAWFPGPALDEFLVVQGHPRVVREHLGRAEHANHDAHLSHEAHSNHKGHA